MRVWNAKLRKLEFTLGSHTASVNVVRWGGEGVIYTASSDRTVKLWDGKDVRLASSTLSCDELELTNLARAGQAHPYTLGPRTLGQHDGAQYGFHPPHGSLRPNRRPPHLRRRWSVLPPFSQPLLTSP